MSARPPTDSRYPVSILVLGLGNDLLSDDGVGFAIVRRVAAQCKQQEDIVVRESMEMGLALLDEVVGCEHLILVDAIVTGAVPAGYLHEFGPEPPRLTRNTGLHFVGVADTLALGKSLGLLMPRDVRIFAFEVLDPFTLGTQLTTPVAAAVAAAVERVTAYARSLLRSRVSAAAP